MFSLLGRFLTLIVFVVVTQNFLINLTTFMFFIFFACNSKNKVSDPSEASSPMVQIRLLLHHQPVFSVEIQHVCCDWQAYAHMNLFDLLEKEEESDGEPATSAPSRELHGPSIEKDHDQKQLRALHKKVQKPRKYCQTITAKANNQKHQQQAKEQEPHLTITAGTYQKLVRLAWHNARLLRQCRTARESIFYRLPLVFWQTHIFPFLAKPACPFAQTWIMIHNEHIHSARVDEKKRTPIASTTATAIAKTHAHRTIDKINTWGQYLENTNWKSRRVVLPLEKPRVWCSEFPKDIGESKLYISKCSCQEYSDSLCATVQDGVMSPCFPWELEFPDHHTALAIAPHLPVSAEHEKAWQRVANRIRLAAALPPWMQNCFRTMEDPALYRVWIWCWQITEGAVRRRLNRKRGSRGWKHSLTEYAVTLFWYLLDPTRAKLMHTYAVTAVGTETVPAYGLVHPSFHQPLLVSTHPKKKEQFEVPVRLSPEEKRAWRRWHAKRAEFCYPERSSKQRKNKIVVAERPRLRYKWTLYGTKRVDSRLHVLFVSSIIPWCQSRPRLNSVPWYH